MAEKAQDRILIVENDPVISDFVARQSLKAAGYQTYVVGDAASAISKAVQISPDVIIVNLNLPGLSGKDLMVALSSQKLEIPVVVLANKGSENDIIQAFRLGAADYLLWPMREAEVITVIERALKQVRERRERERLDEQLQVTNQELQNRVRELTTIFSIGKAVISITDQALLFDKILIGAIKATQADLGWFLLRAGETKTFLLVAQQNLPPTLSVRLNEPWDDSISSLVAMSGEPLSIQGEPIKRFKIAPLGQSALIVPVRVQKEVIGLVVVMRKQSTAFGASEQNLLGAIVDYASISLVNARLFKAVEERAQSLQRLAQHAQTGQKIANEVLLMTQKELRTPLDVVQSAFDRLSKDPAARWTADQRQILAVLDTQIQNERRIVEAIPSLPATENGPTTKPAKLNQIVKDLSGDFQHFAQQNNLTLVAEIPVENVFVYADPGQVHQVVAGLLSNAVKFCNPGGRVTIRLEKTPDLTAHVVVCDSGTGLDMRQVDRALDGASQAEQTGQRRFGGLGISLHLIKTILTNYNGKIWAESQPGRGTEFHFSLPLARI